MSEEIKKINLFGAFAQTAQTLEQAEAKAKSEKGFEKIDHFRTPDEGEYTVRVLPLAPVVDAEGNVTMPMDRQGCEFQVYQTFLELETKPDKKGKTRKVRIPVIRSTQKGVDKSVDLLDEYVRAVKEIYADDQEIIDLVTDSQSKYRIAYRNQRVMYVIDRTGDTPKGPMLWQISNNNWKDIDIERRAVWAKENEKAKKNNKPACADPMCSVADSWALTVTRTGTKFNDTKYTFKIDRGEDKVELTEDDLQKLMDMPRIPDEIYRYTRYQFEATLEFLRQYDEKHELEICKDEEFMEAVEKLKGELSPDDTSHFVLEGTKDKDGKTVKREITLDTLNEQYDYILDNNLDKDSEEYDELKEDIRQFIEDNNLDVVVKHSKKIPDLLDEVEAALESQKEQPKKSEDSASVPAKENEVEDDTDDEADNNSDEKQEEEAPKPRERRRPARPSDDESDDAEKEGKTVEEQASEEAPSRRRRVRVR